MIKAWLAAVLRGTEPVPAPPPDVDAKTILSAASDEGVIAALNARLHLAQASGLPPGLRESLTEAARSQAIQSLRMQAECVRVLAALDQAGLQALLLKGSALAHWAYPSPHLRECSDIDLLFRSREQVEHALAVLAPLNYLPREQALPGDLICFERTCANAGPALAGLEVDLHWRLSSAPMFAFRLGLDELWSASIALPRLAPTARGLSPCHAYLHACMHRVQNMDWGGQDRLKWLYDLHVLGRGFDSAAWAELTRLAAERGLAGVCRDGMDAAECWFGAIAPIPVQQQLMQAEKDESMKVARMQSWAYIQWMNFCAFPTRRQRLRWLWQRLLPDRAFLREQYDGRGLGGVLLLRLRAGWRRLGR